MNTYTSPHNLPHFIHLKQDRESKIGFLINNLKLSDVESDEAFSKSIERIKKSIILSPVEISAGTVVDHEFEQRPMTIQMQLMGAHASLYHHKVVFTFTGSSELFSHIPEQGFSFSSSDHGLILPRLNEFIVYVSFPTLENERAVLEAGNLLSMTKQFIESNNTTVKLWNTTVEARINQQAQAKRQEIIEKFGKR